MIQLNDFRRQWQETGEVVLAAVAAVGESGRYINGAELREFERDLAALWTLACCAGVASGLDAIELGLRALGTEAHDRVLTTPLSSFATTLAIVNAGAVPVFVDTDEYGLIDLDLCEEVLAARTDVRFLVAVHLYGQVLNLEKLDRLRERFGIAIVEDCAHSILASRYGRPAGTAGQIAAASFSPTRNLGALGDGGAVLSNDESLCRMVGYLRDYGQTEKYRHDYLGCNSHLDELQAAILRRAQLPCLAAWTARRRATAARYVNEIRHPEVRVPGTRAGCNPSWHVFPVLVEPARKQEFIDYLRRWDIATGEHYPFLAPEQKAMAGVAFEVIGDLTNARTFAEGEVSLPIHQYLAGSEIDYIIGVCNGWA